MTEQEDNRERMERAITRPKFTIGDAEAVLEDWRDACHKPEIFAWLVGEIKRCYDLLFGGRCVACGEVIGKDKQNQQISDEELMQHILTCPKHPLAEMKRNYDLALDVIAAYQHPGNWNAPEYKTWANGMGPDLANEFLFGVVGKLDEFPGEVENG